MLSKLTILSGQTMTRLEYIKYRDQLSGAGEDLIKQLLRRCETGSTEFPPDFPEKYFDLAAAICVDVQNSGGEVDPAIEEEILAHTATETPLEAVEVLEATPSTDELVLKGALETRLDNGGYSRLTEVFEFDETMTEIRVKNSAIETPEHAGMLMGLGVDFGTKGKWLCIQGAQRLMVKGLSNAMEQICSSLKLSPQSMYNYLGTLPYATPEIRKAVPPTVLVELCRSRYSKDDKENDSIKKELVQQAAAEGWDSMTARSHARMKKGHDEAVEGKPTLREQLSESDRRINALEASLQALVFEYRRICDPIGWQNPALLDAQKALGIEAQEVAA